MLGDRGYGPMRRLTWRKYREVSRERQQSTAERTRYEKPDGMSEGCVRVQGDEQTRTDHQNNPGRP